MITARLFDADGSDRSIEADALAAHRPGPQQLLWVDLAAPSPQARAAVASALGLAPALLSERGPRGPQVRSVGAGFRVDALPVATAQGLTFEGLPLAIVAEGNCLVTMHETSVACLEELGRTAEHDSDLGVLDADALAASLLNCLLSSYARANDELEREIERLEVAILEGRVRDCMGTLQRLRRASSRLRRMLAAHRPVFDALARPDFRPNGDRRSERHFQALVQRYERTLDLVEHARELVIGSFELFSSQTALQTRRAMGRLTFATVVLGGLALPGSLLGTNFEASVFASGDRGFWWTAGGMLAAALAAVALGRWRRWI